MGSPQETAQLIRLLRTPNLANLFVTGAVVGEIQIIAMGPGPMDLVTVLVPSKTTVDLLQYAVQAWWVNSVTLFQSVDNGWLTIPDDQVPGGQVVPANTDPVFQDHTYIRWIGALAPDVSSNSTARQYFDAGLGKLMVSEAGGAYQPIVGIGATGIRGATGVQGGTGVQGITGVAPPAPHLVIPYAASVALDFSPALSPLRKVTLTGDIIFTTTNVVDGPGVSVRIIGDGSPRTLTFPVGWKFLGGAAPASIAANKVAILSTTSDGTTNANIVAGYAVES